MRRFHLPTLLVAALLAMVTPLPAGAGEVHVAVAANFLSTVKVLIRRFESDHKGRVLLSAGSTGKLYAQIMHGAPYDLFLAADSRRPRLLAENGNGIADSRFTYALGQLVLWSRKPDLVDGHGRVLHGDAVQRLAIANPKTAPYGAAARQVLQHLKLWKRYRGRIVRGDNVGQTFEFIASGNADAGFVALSQVKRYRSGHSGSLWQVPADLHDPIEQQAILLTRARGNATARAFVAFLRSDAGRRIIRDSGYRLP
ncbi:MAG: molybdate ABC transporter substrate-binding protein [Gammaproteobacteria bacterium]